MAKRTSVAELAKRDRESEAYGLPEIPEETAVPEKTQKSAGNLSFTGKMPLWGGTGMAENGAKQIETGGQTDYEKALQTAYDAQAKAYAQTLDQMAAAYRTQAAQQDEAYDRAARQAYVNARLSAIGNNELLAAQGLAGGLYQAPRSGYSETGRVMRDNELRGELHDTAMARAQAQAEVERDIARLRAQGQFEAAEQAAKQAEKLIELQMKLDEQRYQRAADAAKLLEDPSYYQRMLAKTFG